MRHFVRHMLPAIAALALVLAAERGVVAECPPAPGGKALAVAPTNGTTDLVRNVVGDRAEMVSLVPAGRSPRARQPTPQDTVTISRAAVFFVDGHYYEPCAN
jgi:iron/zinc/copper transport system substrate-binding protein